MDALEKGLIFRINNGIKVRAPNKANIMARAVRIPNNIVGIKLDRVRIEKPNTIVTVV